MLDKILNNIRKKSSQSALTKDDIAELLRIDTESLRKFEEAYNKTALSEVSDNFFEVNSRQVAEERRLIAEENARDFPDMSDMERRIVNELLAQTKKYVFDGKLGKTEGYPALPDSVSMVCKEEIYSIPKEVRPDLTGELVRMDVKGSSGPSLLFFYKKWLEEKNPEKKQMLYHHFRQGLDLLDLDALTYEIIGTNPNSMSHWLPQLVEACMGHDFFKIPKTTIVKVPLTLLQLTRLDYPTLTQTTLNIVDKWAYEAFELKDDGDYFIKTGTYSSKFDFRNARVRSKKEVRELGEYLLFIHHQACVMAGPLTQPSIYGASTTIEWVVREYIEDKENNPCIYKGLPLHTEYRVFIDCDDKTVIGIVPYWDPDTMKTRFSKCSDADSPHQIHDYIIYKAHEETLMKRYNENKDVVVKKVKEILPSLHLTGQWSLDVMQNGEDFWLIDMATAQSSYFYDRVPLSLRRPTEENWLPQLPGK